jgi:alpha,alpha-trehalase
MTDHGNGSAAGFPPHVLREYAQLADGERGVLVGPRGDLGWLCVPRWDSDAVFSSLIGGSGVYAVTPDTQRFVWGGQYEDGSLIWQSRWVTATGIIECREALAFPGEPHRVIVLRRIVAVEGDARVQVVLDARAGFGQRAMTDRTVSGGVWTARSGALRLRWQGAAGACCRDDGALHTVIDVGEGRHHDLVLELSDQELPDRPVDADQTWAATEHAWAQAVPDLDTTIADRDARHAYAVLRGLTSARGGMVAAATMSLPERSDQGRNYDYRYSWIRDQCYAGQAGAATGGYALLDGAVGFVAGRILADGPWLKPAYTVDGGPVPDERAIDLGGYPGGADKAGNWVNRQFQLDALGEALLLFAAAARLDRLESAHWQAVEVTVAAIGERRGDSDAGIWELHDARWTHSRLTCVSGLRAVAATAPRGQAADWNALADTILADAAADCLHPSGRWQRAPDDARVDAALLWPAIRGGVPADDPRSRATLDAVRAELTDDGYVYRFRHDERPLAEAEGAFVLCGFMMALATHQAGLSVQAARWFERNRAACGPPGLFSEEYDVGQRQLRGNLPQAFVHALLLESSRRLVEPWPAH